jgi:hypothetical protein
LLVKTHCFRKMSILLKIRKPVTLKLLTDSINRARSASPLGFDRDLTASCSGAAAGFNIRSYAEMQKAATPRCFTEGSYPPHFVPKRSCFEIYPFSRAKSWFSCFAKRRVPTFEGLVASRKRIKRPVLTQVGEGPHAPPLWLTGKSELFALGEPFLIVKTHGLRKMSFSGNPEAR